LPSLPRRRKEEQQGLVSNTPLAALATLNDVAFSKMTPGLARRMKYDTIVASTLLNMDDALTKSPKIIPLEVRGKASKRTAAPL
jgi:hypothetical protein